MAKFNVEDAVDATLLTGNETKDIMAACSKIYDSLCDVSCITSDLPDIGTESTLNAHLATIRECVDVIMSRLNGG